MIMSCSLKVNLKKAKIVKETTAESLCKDGFFMSCIFPKQKYCIFFSKSERLFQQKKKKINRSRKMKKKTSVRSEINNLRRQKYWRYDTAFQWILDLLNIRTRNRHQTHSPIWKIFKPVVNSNWGKIIIIKTHTHTYGIPGKYIEKKIISIEQKGFSKGNYYGQYYHNVKLDVLRPILHKEKQRIKNGKSRNVLSDYHDQINIFI